LEVPEPWHAQFDPKNFLARVNIDRLIEKNHIYNENRVEKVDRPCILCRGFEGPGYLLNDKSYLCKTCLAEISTIRYPDKYEIIRRQYIKDTEARRQALDTFIYKCPYRRISSYAGIGGLFFLFIVFIDIFLIIIPIICLIIYFFAQSKHRNRLAKWESTYPHPIEPQLRHFHDPLAELTNRDRIILKVFNNWPGYPPFWEFLRQFILQRDGNRCQVSGCPSRVELHIHHKIPVSQGGEHIPSNLIALCCFHHALEPDEGHERIWGDIKTRYFTMVRAHKRKNPSSTGYHDVRAHVRRLELVNKNDLSKISDFYGISCPFCGMRDLKSTILFNNQKVTVDCLKCSQQWVGTRGLTEETGPRLAEVLSVTRNKGNWKPRWEMLETRTDSTFLLLRQNTQQKKQPRKVPISKKDTPPKCPKCDSPMRFIKPKKGQTWKAFWGCTKYSTTGCNGSRES
jgi:ribosomal protein S27E